MTIVALRNAPTKIDIALESSFSLTPSGLFDLSDIHGTIVELEFNAPVQFPTLYAELFDDPLSAKAETTKTAENFLYYINNGLYNNSIIHRSVDNFVVQGGGYQIASTDGDPPTAIKTKETIANEPGNSNQRGTLAMAKLGGDPDSATSQWFINTNDNSSNLDNQNGGFTVFGKVVGTGMELVDLIAQADVINASALDPAFAELPVWTDEDQQQYFVIVSKARELTSETELMGFSIENSKPEAINAEIDKDGDIVLTLKQPLLEPLGLTLTATSLLDGSEATQSYTVTESGDNNVYRFYNSKSGVHFYTPSKEEWINVANNPDWGYQSEGVAYQALEGEGTELYRFFNPAKGYHFMTTNEQEALNVVRQSAGENYDLVTGLDIASQANGWGYTYEGRSYRVSQSPTAEAQSPVYRFYKPSAGVHFYSASIEEVLNVIANSYTESVEPATILANPNAFADQFLTDGWGYRLEGVGWYAA